METRIFRMVGITYIVIRKDDNIVISEAGIPIDEDIQESIISSFPSIEDFWNNCESLN